MKRAPCRRLFAQVIGSVAARPPPPPLSAMSARPRALTDASCVSAAEALRAQPFIWRPAAHQTPRSRGDAPSADEQSAGGDVNEMTFRVRGRN